MAWPWVREEDEFCMPGLVFVVYRKNHPTFIPNAGRDLFSLADRLALHDRFVVREREAATDELDRKLFGSQKEYDIVVLCDEGEDVIVTGLSKGTVVAFVERGHAGRSLFSAIEEDAPEAEALLRGVPVEDVYAAEDPES